MKKILILAMMAALMIPATVSAKMWDNISFADVPVKTDEKYNSLSYEVIATFGVELNTGEIIACTEAKAKNATDHYLRVEKINQVIGTVNTMGFMGIMDKKQHDYWMEHGTYTDGGTPLTRSWECVETDIKSKGRMLEPGEEITVEFAVKLKNKFDLQYVEIMFQDKCLNPEYEN